VRSLSIVEASINELTHAYQTALREGRHEEAAIWRTNLLERLVVLSDAVAANQRNPRAQSN
jgi:hypothetical protein